jgi:hypothetical protein
MSAHARRLRLAWFLVGSLPGLALSSGGCHRPLATAAAPEAPLPFVDVAESVGLSFRHESGAAGRHYFPETMGPGCAFLDYNGDGWPDVFLIQGGVLPGNPRPARPGNRLFQNDGHGHFHEVPGAAGLENGGYGMGVCAADIDNDGDLDVFITNYGQNALYRNDQGPEGTHFTNISRQAGIAGNGWGASAAFGDYDRDGFVDLFVCSYVRYDPLTSAVCKAPDGSPAYCPPEVYPPARCRLYHNRGDGTFQDVSRRSGVGKIAARALGVEFVDYDHDGWPDIFVACDQSPNLLWHNRRDGTFANVAVSRGVAFDDAGHIQNGMGIDFADTDHNGNLDAVVTTFAGQDTAFYQNEGALGFAYRSAQAGLGGADSLLLGFGCNFLDFDSDGWEDLFVANGHVDDHVDQTVPGVTYAEPCALYRNVRGPGGHPNFQAVPPVPGRGIWRRRVSRGSAIADYDHDGAVDILVANCGDRVELFRNQASPGNHWLTVRLEGRSSNRSAIGARIQLVTQATTQTREVRAGSSYLSQSDLAQTFGLGDADRARQIVVEWPSSRRTVLREVPGGQILAIREPVD